MGQIFNTDLYFWDWDPLDKGCHLTAQNEMVWTQMDKKNRTTFILLKVQGGLLAIKCHLNGKNTSIATRLLPGWLGGSCGGWKGGS